MIEQATDIAMPEWRVEYKPFRHMRAFNVLDADRYMRLARQFEQSVAAAQAATIPGALKHANYDADIISINETTAELFEPFFSVAWLDGLCSFGGISPTRRVSGALHSSAAGSRTGWIHTDLCSGWFDESALSSAQPQAEPVRLFPNRATCNYLNGKPLSSGARPVEYVRATTLIYYLCNDGWQGGDGGETALYSGGRINKTTQTALVPPINNSLLIFPCSPHSYHRFITNPGRGRNSIIAWVHAPAEEADSMWGSGVHRRSDR